MKPAWSSANRRLPCDGYIAGLKDIGYTGIMAIEDETGNDDMAGSIRESFGFLPHC